MAAPDRDTFLRKVRSDHLVKNPAATPEQIRPDIEAADRWYKSKYAGGQVTAQQPTNTEEDGVVSTAVNTIKAPGTWRAAAKSALEPVVNTAKAVKGAAELGFEGLDVLASLGREAAMGAMVDKPTNYLRAAIPPTIADKLGIDKQGAGNRDAYHTAIKEGDGVVNSALKGIGGGLKGGTRAVLDTLSVPESPQQAASKYSLAPLKESVSDFVGTLGQDLAVDPSLLLSATGQGAKRGIGRVVTALERSGVGNLTDDVVRTLTRAVEAGDVKQAKEIYSSLGGKAEHLNAIAGSELEHVANKRFRVGVPFAHDSKLSFEPGAALGKVVHKLTGKSIPEDLTGRLGEKLTRKMPGEFDLPYHGRNRAEALRAGAHYQAKHKTVDAIDELQGPVDLGAFEAKHGVSAAESGPDPFKTLPRLIAGKKQAEAAAQLRQSIDAEFPDAPPELKKAVDSLFSTVTLGPGLDDVVHKYDQFQNAYKEVRLTGNPAWAFLNFLEDMIKAKMHGVAWSDYMSVRGMDKADVNKVLLTRQSGDQITAGQFLKFADSQGFGTKDTFSKFGIDKLGKKLDRVATAGSVGVNKLIRPLEEMRETAMKRAMLLSELRKGVSPSVAANTVRKVHFDTVFPNANKELATVSRLIRRLKPFSNYALKSAATVPGLVARNPGAANLPQHLTQAAQDQADRDYMPKEHVRNSGLYANMPTGARDLVNDYLLGGKLTPEQTLTLQARGSPLESTSAMVDLLEGQGGWTPPVQYGLNMMGQGPFGYDKALDADYNLLDVPESLLSDYTSSPVHKGVNALGRNALDWKSAWLGYPANYKNADKASINERLGAANIVLPTPIKLTGQNDIGFERRKAREVNKQRGKAARKR